MKTIKNQYHEKKIIWKFKLNHLYFIPYEIKQINIQSISTACQIFFDYLKVLTYQTPYIPPEV